MRIASELCETSIDRVQVKSVKERELLEKMNATSIFYCGENPAFYSVRVILGDGV